MIIMAIYFFRLRSRLTPVICIFEGNSFVEALMFMVDLFQGIFKSIGDCYNPNGGLDYHSTGKIAIRF